VKKKLISIRLKPELIESIDNLAIEEDRDRTGMINRLLKEALKNHNGKNQKRLKNE